MPAILLILMLVFWPVSLAVVCFNLVSMVATGLVVVPIAVVMGLFTGETQAAITTVYEAVQAWVQSGGLESIWAFLQGAFQG